MKLKPAISVIIPTYNRLIGLKYSLDSLVEQDMHKDEYEVLICDDGSSEDTQALVSLYEQSLNVIYLYQEDNGFRAAAARNMGIRKASGDICVFIDNGIILQKNALNEHLRIHRENIKPCAIVGYVYGFDVFDRNEDEIIDIVKGQTIDDAIEVLKDKGILDIREKFYKLYSDNIDELPAPFVLFWTCHVSMSKNSLVEIGMFDENFTTWGGEDSDIALALQQYGAKFILARSAKSIHYPHKKELDFTNEIEQADLHIYDKKNYMLSKYPTRAVYLWTQDDDDLMLNQLLLEEQKKLEEQEKMLSLG